MIKAMKILAFLSVLAALGTAGWIAAALLGGDDTPPKVLSEPGVLEQFTAGRPGTENLEEKESPLVTQARLFALGINPPPPPKPIEKPPVQTQKTVPAARQPEPENTRPLPPPTISTKFKLLATAWYPDYPSKSLALLDLGGTIGRKWHRSGEQVNHQVIKEIQEDHIVLDQSGRLETLAIERKPEPQYKLMLKSEAEKLESASAASAEASSASAIPSLPATASTRTTIPVRPAVSTNRSAATVVRPPTQTGTASTDPSETASNQPDRTYRKPPVLPSPEERRKTVDNDISNIQRLMQESGKMAEMTEEEKAEEMKAWNALLLILQEEKNRLHEADQADPKSQEGTANNTEGSTEKKSY
ncbi:MAG: hypothetical protein JXA82_15540 [Sedimentisphaerales bacterium]|nr:hypothetical protein [Sedimentisphaerales bacterium]